MSSATVPTSPPARRNQTGLIAGAVIILVAAVAGWWIYAQSVPRPSSANDFRADPGNRGGWFANARQPGVVPRPNDPVTFRPLSVTVRDGELGITSSKRTDNNWNIYVSFNGESLGGADAQRLMLAVRRVLDSKVPPANLKLTVDQRTRLAAIPLTPLELSDDQLKQLTDLLNQSQKLTANSPELAPIKQSLQALAAQVKGIDKEAVKAKYAERDAKFRSILNEEQISSLLGGATRATPTAAPPAAPAK